mmetsp:Transcript_5446/g.12734  ORF Transcript_5446/g.12734 Transcript_5446/m.12734 type:complete len:263 (-) Transcript_5446:128-916(-)
MKALSQQIEEHIHSIVAKASSPRTRKHVEWSSCDIDVQAFVCRMLERTVQPDAAEWQILAGPIRAKVELAMVKMWHFLQAELRERVEELLPRPVLEDFANKNAFFQSTGCAFLSKPEYFASWCEDLACQMSRSFEDWDSRWNVFAVKLKPLGINAMQNPDGSPCGLLFPVETAPWSLPWALDWEYQQLQHEFATVVEHATRRAERDWRQMERQAKRYAAMETPDREDAELDTDMEVLRQKHDAAINKRPRMSHEVRLWKATV